MQNVLGVLKHLKDCKSFCSSQDICADVSIAALELRELLWAQDSWLSSLHSPAGLGTEHPDYLSAQPERPRRPGCWTHSLGAPVSTAYAILKLSALQTECELLGGK